MVTGVFASTPTYVPPFIPRIGFGIPFFQFCLLVGFRRILLTHKLSRFPLAFFLRKKKTLRGRVFNSGRLGPTALTQRDPKSLPVPTSKERLPTKGFPVIKALTLLYVSWDEIHLLLHRGRRPIHTIRGERRHVWTYIHVYE